MYRAGAMNGSTSVSSANGSRNSRPGAAPPGIAGRRTEFRPLRLQNGLYLQLRLHAAHRRALRFADREAVTRQLALIADKYDRGYGHFTTRQNLQFNWPKLRDAPAILDGSPMVEMHAIQTSGNVSAT